MIGTGNSHVKQLSTKLGNKPTDLDNFTTSPVDLAIDAVRLWMSHPTDGDHFQARINGHFRSLNWRYLPYIRLLEGLYKAYVKEYPHKIWPYMVQYLHFRILTFPLIGVIIVCPEWCGISTLGQLGDNPKNRSGSDLLSKTDLPPTWLYARWFAVAKQWAIMPAHDCVSGGFWVSVMSSGGVFFAPMFSWWPSGTFSVAVPVENLMDQGWLADKQRSFWGDETLRMGHYCLYKLNLTQKGNWWTRFHLYTGNHRELQKVPARIDG